MNQPTYTMLVQDSAGTLYAVRETFDAALGHVWHAIVVKRYNGGIVPKTRAREILLRKAGCEILADNRMGATCAACEFRWEIWYHDDHEIARTRCACE